MTVEFPSSYLMENLGRTRVTPKDVDSSCASLMRDLLVRHEEYEGGGGDAVCIGNQRPIGDMEVLGLENHIRSRPCPTSP